MYDYHESGPRRWSTSGTPRGPRWMRDILGSDYFDRVTYIGHFSTPEDAGWVDAFNRLKSVKTLLLSGPHVTDEILDRMHSSTALLELHLTNASISDDGLRNLAKFPNLRWLVMNSTSITGDGMVHLAAIGGLQEINLRNTKVSDESVPSIATFHSLQKIDLRNTLVTKDGAEKIREHAPKLTVLQ